MVSEFRLFISDLVYKLVDYVIQNVLGLDIELSYNPRAILSPSLIPVHLWTKNNYSNLCSNCFSKIRGPFKSLPSTEEVGDLDLKSDWT